ncbi:M20 metallopeptidase family protein [Mahella australiensis]|uniref:Amidohydrolase n=1 Tax=Mahella australiensis (strain DSM 15567 / CIP 107919 / 50-1 BON) TaxID=697281 RepID=F3ZXT4_MAHA5|nr:amidohydrolase [Mahella australiensis]AEE96604.1 amidohydrolase [Mahella australiensis 50-1 BON]
MIEIDSDVSALKDYIIDMRRRLHMHPETGFNEIFTRDMILEQLNTMHFDEIKVMARTGIKAVMMGSNASKTIALRADMDALCVTELNDKPYISQNKGFMHACGHDGHMAMLLGIAKLLSEHKSDLSANVVLIFQPAEESEGGAPIMIEQGVLDDPKVDEIYAMHIFPDVEQGKVGIRSGPIMAQTAEFDIEIMGRSAHGAMPHKGIDTIVIASHIIQMFQSILTRNVDPADQALITIGRICGGERRNIIAKHTVLEGMLRTFSDDVYELIKSRIMAALEGMERAYGASLSYKEVVNYPVVFNDIELTRRFISIIGEENIVEVKPQMIAEDFSFYQKKVSGVYFFLGSKNEKKGFAAPLHSNRFDFDEDILLAGVQIYKKLLNMSY